MDILNPSNDTGSAKTADCFELVGTYVAGVRYYPKELVLNLRLWEVVDLTRDPANQHDPNAIQVRTKEDGLFGHVPRELAAVLAPAMDLAATQTMMATITGLRSDDSHNLETAALRVRISISVPQSWLNPIKDQPDKDTISYLYEDSRSDIYVLLNCGEDTFRKIQHDISNELVPVIGSGLCYRPGDNGRDYQWYLKFSRSSGIFIDAVEDYFRTSYGVIPERELVEQLEADLSSLWQVVEELEREKAEWEKYAVEIDDSKPDSTINRADSDDRIARLESVLKDKNDEIRRLQYKLDSYQESPKPKEHRNAEIPDQVADALRDYVAPHLPPVDALRLVGTIWPNRIIVLTPAYSSAEESEQFKHRKRVYEFLWRLATEYWSCLNQGHPDEECRKCFGSAYAATESETTKGNETALSARTFEYKGRRVTMLKHLKIGVKPSPHESLRIHFEWDPNDRRIVIGYCGPHLALR